ncbi:MAG: glycosyltransferase family 4 protein [Chloroflexi bacterium]|nr:glycosyltransferase family 4 protein [Chloroflexota bacterium]
MKNKLRFCFVCFTAYPLLTAEITEAASFLKPRGGAEAVQVLLARGLAKKGARVSFVVGDYEQDTLEVREGIRILKTSMTARWKGLSWMQKIRTGFSALASVWRALDKADSDIYYHRGFAGEISALLATYCWLKRRRLVLATSSDGNVDTRLRKPAFYKVWLFRFAVKKADCVIAQNVHQQNLLASDFHRKSIIMPSCCELPAFKPAKTKPPIVLWVATIYWVKQPELFLKLAASLPDARFQMIGGAEQDIEFYNNIEKSARSIPNLEFVGFVPHQEISRYFGEASVLVNTSRFEGFPVTFLEAWASYTPVVSLNADPDEVICRNRLGFHSRTFEQMVLDVKQLLEDDELREEMAANSRKYVEDTADVDRIVQEYIKLFSTPHKT